MKGQGPIYFQLGRKQTWFMRYLLHGISSMITKLTWLLKYLAYVTEVL